MKKKIKVISFKEINDDADKYNLWKKVEIEDETTQIRRKIKKRSNKK